ncbi:TIGR03016 family PEP-CTERM system-associated outer membrane protein [Inhella sp.]|uniref:TIGR03016 family PEP-CTERM system-associated outer membrane protein n=1 Tax=Inhella sp. TaxID=1921806 RepID=UPI0035AD8FD5
MRRRVETTVQEGAQAFQTLILLLGAFGTASAWAQVGPASAFQARMGGTLQISDNLSSRQEVQDRGALLVLTPGLSYSRRTASVQASVDYGLSLVAPWRVVEQPDAVQHQLNARARFSPQGTGLLLDGGASIGRQSLSAFGLQRPVGGSAFGGTENQREVYALNFSPSWQTRIGSLANFSVSHRSALTNTKDSLVGDATTQETTVSLGSISRGALGWGLRGARSAIKPKAGLRGLTESAVVYVSWSPDADWQINANAGQERSNLRQQGRESGPSHGLGLTWTPSPRTQLQAQYDDRAFGRTHRLSFNHRMPRANFSLSESRTLSEPGALGGIGARTHYELLFAQLATVEPDPLRRDQLVRQQLLALGLDPNGIATNGLITSRPALTRQQVLTGAWNTPRSTWSMALSRSDSRRFGTALQGFEDLAQSSRVLLTSANLSAAYRFSSRSSLNLTLQVQRNEGDTDALRNDVQSGVLTWTMSLDRRQQFNASLRHSESDAAQRSFSENALVMGYQYQF